MTNSSIRPSKLCFRKPVLVRSSPHLSNGFLLLQTQPSVSIAADPCAKRGVAIIVRPGGGHILPLTKEWEEREEKDQKLKEELRKEMGTIGSSNGWLPTLKDGVLRLRELNLNHDTDPKRIVLPPLVTLPHCQTQYITNVAMSSFYPDCVVAVKFLGPQLSFYRLAPSNSEWINIRISNPCFFSSPVMFSMKDDMFRIASPGGHLIGSWDPHKHSKNPKLQSVRFQNLPELTKTKRDLLDSCYTSEHLVESRTSNETFMVKLYTKTGKIINDTPRMKTEAIMVFKLDEEGNAVYTQNIGNQSIFLTNSQALCDPFGYSLLWKPNSIRNLDVDDHRYLKMADLGILLGGWNF